MPQVFGLDAAGGEEDDGEPEVSSNQLYDTPGILNVLTPSGASRFEDVAVLEEPLVAATAAADDDRRPTALVLSRLVSAETKQKVSLHL